MKKKIYAVLIFVAGIIAEFFINKCLDNISVLISNKNIENKLLSFFLHKNYTLAAIILSCIIVFFITIIIMRLLLKTNKSPEDKRKENFIKVCPKALELEDGIVLEYSVGFDCWDALPFPYNIIIKCTKDGSSSNTILDDNNYCISAFFCKQRCLFREYFATDKKNLLKKQIQSQLISYWSDFK